MGGEHMPDKAAYINEMMRVLKPGGKYVMATWCQRDDREKPFSEKDERDLRFLNEETIASWRHSIWVGVYDPRGFIFKPNKYLKCVRDAYCLERMHRAFDRGLMQYGMFAAT